MLKNRLKTIMLVIILIILLIGIGYYFYTQSRGNQNNSGQPSQAQTVEERLLEFKNLDENLNQAMLEEYRQEFERNKNLIINNPQALNPSSWLQIARLKKYMQDYGGARDIYLFLNSKDPSNYTAEANLADLYANYINDYNQAATHYWQAINKTTLSQIKLLYYRNLADIYAFKLKNQRQDFEDKMMQVQNDDYFKDSPDFYTMLAKYYEDIGENQKAVEYLETALEFVPGNQPIQEKLDYLKNK